MHISEGLLTPSVLAAGAALGAGGLAVGIRKMEVEEVPKVAVLSSAFFVASLIHFRVGMSSVHLVLNGLAGIVLGWTVFPALLVALFLQAILFQFGGMTTLGVNTVTMALPAVVCYYLLGGVLRRTNKTPVVFAAGFGAGILSVILSVFLMAACLLSAGRGFAEVAGGVSVLHLPVAVVDGVITGFAVVFLKKIRPEILQVRP